MFNKKSAYILLIEQEKHMKKLTITEIMNLSSLLAKDEWIVTLIDMNNRGQLEDFFKLIGKPDIFNKILEERKNGKSR